MTGIAQLGGDPGYVVVADERQRRERAEEAVMPVEGPGQLEEVAVVQRAPDRLPQLVLGDRVDTAVGGVARVVAVDHLGGEPGGAGAGADPRQGLAPDRLRDGAGRVEAP